MSRILQHVGRTAAGATVLEEDSVMLASVIRATPWLMTRRVRVSKQC